MKFIPKDIRNEPLSLKSYRETLNATYEGFIDTNQLLKKALLAEQGHLCAYCLRRISLEWNPTLRKYKIEVEHYQSQHSFPDLSLNFKNMLGVCNGNTGEKQHCDKSKGHVNLLKLNPTNKDCETQMTYSISGEILSKTGLKEVESDLKYLNLNDRNLIVARRNAIDIAKEKLIKEKPAKQWTKRLIQKEIDEWAAKGKDKMYRPYCQIVIWFWEKQKQSNRYPD